MAEGIVRPALWTPSRRTVNLILLLLSDYVLDEGVRVGARSITEVMQDCGVEEHAARSALSRMTRRELIDGVRHGRPIYHAIHTRGADLLTDLHRRVSPVDPEVARWDGSWTLLTFTLPDAWQKQRHELRARLGDYNFGALRGGLWIAPSYVGRDVRIDDLASRDHIRIFTGRPVEPEGVAEMVSEAWDLDGLDRGFRAFIRSWAPDRGRGSSLVVLLTLIAEWADAVRGDPRLAADVLPSDWPRAEAQELFETRLAEVSSQARREAAERLDTRPPRGSSS